MSGWMLNDPIRWINRAGCPIILGLLAATVLCACEAPQETSEKNLFRSSSQPHLTASPALRQQLYPTQMHDSEGQSLPAERAEHEATVNEKHDELEVAVAAPIEPEQEARAPQQEQEQERVQELEPKTDPHVGGRDESRNRAPSETRISPAPLKRIDPGAAYIARTIREKIEARDPTVATAVPEQPIVIGVAAVRNQSRARSAEFESFLDRFAKLLTDAGDEHGILFTTDADEQTDYEFVGTAYLLSADGFDWWELFLSLRPGHQSWTLWRCDHPVRVMRHPRPEHQQVFLAPLPRVRH